MTTFSPEVVEAAGLAIDREMGWASEKTADLPASITGKRLATAALTASPLRECVEALQAALPRLAHPARCHRVRPAAEWAEHGSASFDNCDCEISQVRAALAKVVHP